MDLWFDFSNKKQKCIVINKRGKYFCLSIYHLFIVCMLYECAQVWAGVHAYVCASMWRLEIDVWCLHFFEIFTVTILCVCVYVMCTCYRCTLLCLSGSQIHTTVSGLQTHSAVSTWITHIHYCLQLDHRYTLLCPAGLQIHTIVSGFIRAWGSKLNFSCLWTKCFTHGTSPFLIHRVIIHRTIYLCHLMKEDWRGQLEISKWSALPNFLVWPQHTYSHEKKQKHSFPKHGWSIHIRKDNGNSGSGRGIIHSAQWCPHFQGRRQVFVFVWPHPLNQQTVQSSLGIRPFPASPLLPSQVPHLQFSFKSPPLTKVRDEFERKPMGCVFSIVSASCFCWVHSPALSQALKKKQNILLPCLRPEISTK